MPIKAIIAVSAIAATLSSCSFFDSKMVKLCEEGIRQRLASPAGYKRGSASSETNAATERDVRAFYEGVYAGDKRFSDASVESAMYDKLEGYELKTATIDYDAPNAYGALVRGRIVCSYLASPGREEPSGFINLLYNGRTWSDFGRG